VMILREQPGDKQRNSRTFLCNQTLASSGQSHHDDANTRILGLHTDTISSFARLHKIASGHFAHLGRKEAIGLRLRIRHCGCNEESSSFRGARMWVADVVTIEEEERSCDGVGLGRNTSGCVPRCSDSMRLLIKVATTSGVDGLQQLDRLDVPRGVRDAKQAWFERRVWCCRVERPDRRHSRSERR
jgi:hypothetical protein